MIDKLSLISALERVDIVVRDFNKVVVIKMTDDGQCFLSGRAPEFGEAMEQIICAINGGDVTIGVNTRYFHDALKAIDGSSIKLLLNGPDDHMMVKPGEPGSFMCLVAPLKIESEQFLDIEAENSDLMGSSPEPDVL
jgi:DNA polymerase-3 subunit beta